MPGLIGEKAPEFPDDLQWFNSQPLKLSSLRGGVVLIDFWTYSCINCLRSIPHVRSWYERYRGHDFTVVGVHSPEFGFEKRPENVDRALKELDIKYPVVLDSEHAVWRAYRNAVWPRKFLIGPDGNIMHDHAGEGAYVEIEQLIQTEVRKLHPKIFFPYIKKSEGGEGVCHPVTEERYLGRDRGRVANVPEYEDGNRVLFRDTVQHETDSVYLEGFWEVGEEHVRPLISLTSGTTRLTLSFRASEVNLVADSLGGEPQKVSVLLDGAPLTPVVHGLDVSLEDGKSFLMVDRPRLYRVLDSKEYLEGAELAFLPETEDIRFYTFTFGARGIPKRE